MTDGDRDGVRSGSGADHRGVGRGVAGRIVPADRAGVRKFLARFGGRELEVALEATTGWRFVVERLGGNRACLALARKLLKRSYHILKELGDPALQPVAS